MRADGWSLARSDVSVPSEPPASEPAPKRELRVAQASDATRAKPSDKPSGGETDKKIVKEVHVGGSGGDSGDDEGE